MISPVLLDCNYAMTLLPPLQQRSPCAFFVTIVKMTFILMYANDGMFSAMEVRGSASQQKTFAGVVTREILGLLVQFITYWTSQVTSYFLHLFSSHFDSVNDFRLTNCEAEILKVIVKY